MKLDTVEQRRELVDELKKVGVKFRDSIADEEDDHDWGGASVAVDNLLALTPMFAAERIFLDALTAIKSSSIKEQAAFANIVTNRLNYFVEMILFYRLDKTVEDLNDWGFRTEDGKKFHRKMHKKLDELVEKYQDIYDL